MTCLPSFSPPATLLDDDGRASFACVGGGRGWGRVAARGEATAASTPATRLASDAEADRAAK